MFSPNGEWALVTSDEYLKVLHLQSGILTGTKIANADSFPWAVFSPDGSRIAVVNAEKTVQIFDTLLGQRIGTPIQHQGAITFVRFSPDGDRILTGSDDSTQDEWVELQNKVSRAR